MEEDFVWFGYQVDPVEVLDYRNVIQVNNASYSPTTYPYDHGIRQVPFHPESQHKWISVAGDSEDDLSMYGKRCVPRVCRQTDSARPRDWAFLASCALMKSSRVRVVPERFLTTMEANECQLPSLYKHVEINDNGLSSPKTQIMKEGSRYSGNSDRGRYRYSDCRLIGLASYQYLTQKVARLTSSTHDLIIATIGH